MAESRFAGKRALVTGAGKGSGREIATVLAGHGAVVVALSRTQADLDSLRDEIGCETMAVNLADADAARDAARRAGDIDLLVNNAGVSILEPFLDATPDVFDKVMAVNVRAVMLISQVVARGMIDRGVKGSIVNLSSTGSKFGLRDHAAYCASKGAVDQLTRVMALELGEHGIRVNAVNPTVVMTPMGKMAWGDPAKAGPMLAEIPMGRFVEPVEVANAVAWLLSDEASMVHGVTLPVDGGLLATP